MAGRQPESDSFTTNFAEMSENQLYGIMSQMKNLIEQNQQQARLILAENPSLTKALFQAQILLGMVKIPKVTPSAQQEQSQPSEQPVQTPSVQVQSVSVAVPAGSQVEDTGVQVHIPARKESNHPSSTIPYTSVLTGTYPPMLSHPQPSLHPAKAHMGTQGMPISHPQSSQIAKITLHQHQSTLKPPLFHQSQAPIISNHPQHIQRTSGASYSVQPPLPPQPRPPTVQPFQHQLHPQMLPHSGFQTSPASQPHVQQQQFTGANRHLGNIEFRQGSPPIPKQLPPPPRYQGGGLRFGPDLNNQGGRPMQVDRAPWMPGPPDNPTSGVQLPGPPPLPTQMGPGMQPPRPQPIPSELGRSLLQQVMCLTPEQINCLPPEQRQQVYQLQQMLRQ